MTYPIDPLPSSRPTGGGGGGGGGRRSNSSSTEPSSPLMLDPLSSPSSSTLPQQQPLPPPKMSIGNGILRFGLEVTCWSSMGIATYKYLLTRSTNTHKSSSSSLTSPIFGAIVVPLLAMCIWSIFTVRNDPSRNPNPIISISGPIRFLCIETPTFLLGIVSITYLNNNSSVFFPIIITLLTLLHHGLYWKRILWLFSVSSSQQQ